MSGDLVTGPGSRPRVAKRADFHAHRRGSIRARNARITPVATQFPRKSRKFALARRTFAGWGAQERPAYWVGANSRRLRFRSRALDSARSRERAIRVGALIGRWRGFEHRQDTGGRDSVRRKPSYLLALPEWSQ